MLRRCCCRCCCLHPVAGFEYCLLCTEQMSMCRNLKPNKRGKVNSGSPSSRSGLGTHLEFSVSPAHFGNRTVDVKYFLDRVVAAARQNHVRAHFTRRARRPPCVQNRIVQNWVVNGEVVVALLVVLVSWSKDSDC
jgi:hypothetical protein